MLLTNTRIALALTGLVSITALTAVGQAGEINSNLAIEAGQTFELGGGQAGRFVVNGRNTGPVAVEVLTKAAGKDAVMLGTVAPGGAVDARVGSGETALLRNTSDRETARLKLRISGDTAALGMTYSANP